MVYVLWLSLAVAVSYFTLRVLKVFGGVPAFQKLPSCANICICVDVWCTDVFVGAGWLQVRGKDSRWAFAFCAKRKKSVCNETCIFRQKPKKKLAVQKSRKHVLPDSVSDLLGTTLSFRQFVAKREQSPLHKRIESTADHCQKTKSPFSWKKMSQKIALRGHIRDVLW